MNTDARWQQEIIAALDLTELFIAAGLAFPESGWAASIKPTDAESARAAAIIRAWRCYLPEACVSSMIADGWQWST